MLHAFHRLLFFDLIQPFQHIESGKQAEENGSENEDVESQVFLSGPFSEPVFNPP